MAKALAEIHEQVALTIHLHPDDVMLDFRGTRSRYLMEMLGDALNNMDAVADEDAWMNPVFEQARKMFPLAIAQGGSGT